MSLLASFSQDSAPLLPSPPSPSSPPFEEERRKLVRLERISLLKWIAITVIIVTIMEVPLCYIGGYFSGHLMGYNKGYSEGEFSFYYVKPVEQKYGANNLADTLKGQTWIENYQEGIFDCSEMSAYLEWYLENEGWHALIIVGDSPFNSGKHAWLLVETSQNTYTPVESTNIHVVWADDPHFNNYFNYDYEFETIQDAIAFSETEFDWWKS